MGKNWMDPAVITESSKVFGSFSLVLTGVALWDVLSTLWFEWQVITGKRKFKWPMIIYEIARVSMILQVFAITINRNALREVPCTPLMFMSKFCDTLGISMASLILILRTRAVWHRDNKITSLLSLLFIGQIAAWSQTFRYSTARWNPARKVCDVISTSPRSVVISVWAYTMGFDFIILVLCSYRLVLYRSTTLGSLLLRDGISYFCFAFGANLVQTVVAGLQLNPVMNITMLPLAMVVSVITATTVFRNVFTASESFYGELQLIDETGPTSNGPFHIPSGADVVFNHNTSTRPELSASEIPHGKTKSKQGIGSISVHSVMDVEEIGSGSEKGSTRRHQNSEELGQTP